MRCCQFGHAKSTHLFSQIHAMKLMISVTINASQYEYISFAFLLCSVGTSFRS